MKRNSLEPYHSLPADKPSIGKKVSLDNFNPLNPRRRLNSPRSLEACRANGISPDKVFYSAYAKVKERTALPKRQSAEYLKARYIETESERQRLVAKLKEMRKALMDQEFMHKDLITRSFSTANSRSNEKGEMVLLWRKSVYRTLDKHLVQRETQNSRRKVDKEISFMLHKHYKTRMQNIVLKPLSRYKHMQRKANKLLKNYSSNPHCRIIKFGSIENLQYGKLKTHIEKRKLLKEKHKEKRDVVERMGEYKRELLERKIQSCSYRTSVIQRKYEELLRLRQGIRKNALIKKHAIKADIEKVILRKYQ